jgi:hypothetical protein
MSLPRSRCLDPVIIPGDPRGQVEYFDKEEKRVKWYHARPAVPANHLEKKTALVLFYDLFGFSLVRPHPDLPAIQPVLTPSPTPRSWRIGSPTTSGSMSTCPTTSVRKLPRPHHARLTPQPTHPTSSPSCPSPISIPTSKRSQVSPGGRGGSSRRGCTSKPSRAWSERSTTGPTLPRDRSVLISPPSS